GVGGLRLPGAGAELRRLLPAASRVLPAGPVDLRQVRRAAGIRRGDLRVRPARLLLRLRTVRVPAGHHHLRQGGHLRVLPAGPHVSPPTFGRTAAAARSHRVPRARPCPAPGGAPRWPAPPRRGGTRNTCSPTRRPPGAPPAPPSQPPGRARQLMPER